jgi:hypothetical protein
MRCTSNSQKFHFYKQFPTMQQVQRTVIFVAVHNKKKTKVQRTAI